MGVYWVFYGRCKVTEVRRLFPKVNNYHGCAQILLINAKWLVQKNGVANNLITTVYTWFKLVQSHFPLPKERGLRLTICDKDDYISDVNSY